MASGIFSTLNSILFEMYLFPLDVNIHK